ncbi:THAP domain-containing protein 11-like isoform X2 [Notothenia coriiceps]|uniref:THAP domain-containing protein 11-like isoform X2 n=1 Tax=Notothenia coriiceps TaxID=8208 RepID=A0A6I9PG62_9TELE|nr:PREDICTED: THAP domain-containing protein 11-like isoform X2 [Notothenia coriiceps]
MVDNCCAPGCTNRRGKKKGVSYYRIPKDAERREKWIAAIKRDRSRLNKTERWDPPAVCFRLCSDHFISGRKSDNPLSPDFIPSIFDYLPSPEKTRRKTRLEVFNRRQKAKLHKVEQAKLSAEAIRQRTSTDCPQKKAAQEDQITEPLKEPPISDPLVDSGDEDPVQPDPATPPCTSETCFNRIQCLELECQALRTENMLLRDKINRKTLTEISLHNDDKKVNVLTGLATYTCLMTIFQYLAPFLKLKSSITCFQQYMLTLMKLRMNFTFDFGFLFWHRSNYCLQALQTLC